MADISKTVAIIFEGEDKTSATLAKVEAGLKGIDTEAKGAAGGLRQVEDGAAGIGKAGVNIEGLATAIKGLAIAAVVADFIAANVALEKFEKVMVAATGSSDAAAKEFDFVRGVAQRFGVELLDTADAYSKFAASAKGTALEGEGARLVFEGITGTMARLGASSVDVSGALVQLGQGVSKGKFELDDLKSIAERIPGFFVQFADSMGISTAELYDLISAGQIGSKELLIFSDTLRDGLAGVDFDGFAASSARFKNAISEAYLEIGKTGVFDVLTKGVQLGTVAIVGLIAGFEALGTIIGAVAGAIVSGNWSLLGDVIADAISKGADKTRPAVDALLGVEKAAEKTGAAAADAGRQIAEGMDKGAASAKDTKAAFADVDKALKALGIDPKIFVDPIKEVQKAFADLASNPAVRGDQFFAGFLVTLDKIKSGGDIAELGEQVKRAYEKGTISSDAFAAATELLGMKLDGTYKGIVAGTEISKENASAMERQAKAADKAAEAAAKTALELEKLASNERIKFIEATVQLNIAALQADVEKVKAIFASIDNTVNSTGDLLGELFGNLQDAYAAPGFQQQYAIEAQIRLENERREKALKLQEELTKATVDELRARTKALQNGDALIKIDGAGLKPHLEAFMWEILRTIQTRVNKDGLRLLVGV
jgi:tape measure domain-containing protein